MSTTRQCARVTLTALVGLLVSIAAWGQNLDATGQWTYIEITKGSTCSIKPADKAKLSGHVTIPEKLTPGSGGGELTVTKINFFAFDRCTEMTSVTIPSSVTEVAGNAFYWCTGLTSVEIPNGVTTIGWGAFEWCTGLASVSIPSSVTKIEKTAFRHCYKLTSVAIPSSVTVIGEGAFADCPALSGISVDPANTAYASEAGVLFNKNKTELLRFPAGKKGEYAVPSGVETIAKGAFAYSAGLSAVSFPSSVAAIGDAAFTMCNALTEITVNPANTNFSSEAGVLFNSDKTKLIYFPAGVGGEYSIPNSVTTVGKFAFAYCAGLTAVTLPAGVTTIEDYAFSHCSGLPSVNIPNGVAKIGNSAFTDCTELITATIPGSITSIGSDAFSGCKRLALVYWNASPNVNNSAFDRFVGGKVLRVAKGEKGNFENLSWVQRNNFTVSDAEVVVTFNANGGWFGNKVFKHIELQPGTNKLAETAVEMPKGVDRVFKEWFKAGATEGFDFNSEIISEDLLLTARWDKYWVSFLVKGESINALQGAEVRVGSNTKIADKNGFVKFTLPNGVHEYTVSLAGYETLNGKIAIEDRDINNMYLLLLKPGENEYVLTIAAGPNGAIRVTRNDANGEALESNVKVKEGDKLFIAATPASGYELATLTVNGNAHGNNSAFTVEKTNVEVKATFKKKKDADSTNAVESTLLADARIAQNPVDHTLALEGLEVAEWVEIYSLTGSLVYSQKLQGENRVEIAARGWASGAYVARIIAKDGEKALRVVKR